MYSLLKFVHVVSIAIWVGGIITMLVLSRRMAGSGDPALQKAFGQQAAAAGMVLFGPAALIAVITGIGLVQVGHLGFHQVWVLWGIIGAVASFVIGGALTGGTARKLAAEMSQGNVDRNRVASMQSRMLMFATLNILLLLSIVWAMVAKPA